MRKTIVVLMMMGIIGVGFAQTAPVGQASATPMGMSVTNPNFTNAAPVNSALASPSQLANLQQKEGAVLSKLDIPQKVDQLQQQLADMRGLVEIQGHELQQLELKVQALESGASGQAGKTKMPVAGAGSVPVKALPASTAKNTGMQGSAMYLQAYQLIQEKQYTPAMQLLQSYLKQYPNGSYAMSAHYWLGELYAVSGDAKSAEQQLTTVVTNYPKSERVPDSMLRLGIIAYSQGQYKQAASWYNKLMSQHPNSSAAQIAQSELEQMQKAGYVQ